MVQLGCTTKVLEQFRLRKDFLSEPRRGDAVLGNWYVGLVTIERRKTLIFMNERTLLSFLLFGVKKSNAQALGDLFIAGLTQLLQLEGFSQPGIAQALGGCELVELSRTMNRKALGNLNNLARLYRWHILSEGGFKHCDLWQIISGLNRMPQRNIGWGYSIDLAKDLVALAHRSA